MTKLSFLWEQLRDIAMYDPTVYAVLRQQHETNEPDMQAAVRLIHELSRQKQELQKQAVKDVQMKLTPEMLIIDDILLPDKKKQPRGKRVTRKCKNCRTEFYPRIADINRGWGRFCSKSCKAEYQTYVGR